MHSLHSPRRRPAGVWIICGLYALSTVSTVISVGAVMTGITPLNEAQQQYFDGLSAVDYLANGLVLAVSAWGVYDLFRLRRGATRAFAVALLLSLGFTVVHLLMTNWSEAAGDSGVTMMAGGWMLAAAVLWYVWRLQRRGVLT